MRTKQKVEMLMRLDTRMRENDKLLWLKVCEDEGFHLTRSQRFIFLGLPSMETVARRRRELSGKYPPSEKILNKRYRHFKDYTKEFSKQGFLTKILKKRGIIGTN